MKMEVQVYMEQNTSANILSRQPTCLAQLFIKIAHIFDILFLQKYTFSNKKKTIREDSYLFCCLEGFC